MSRFATCAAHFLGECAADPTTVVLTTMQSIFAGAWRWFPSDMSSVEFVLTRSHEMVEAGDFHWSG